MVFTPILGRQQQRQWKHPTSCCLEIRRGKIRLLNESSRCELQAAIRKLSQTASELWREYLEVGPGALEPSALTGFSDAAEKASELLAITATNETAHQDLMLALDELEPLLRRCVERTEGLCFVTGEAGLIPRKDLHQKCEAALSCFEQFLDSVADS